jgi:O-antigen/teichoic acid export membrane protein
LTRGEAVGQHPRLQTSLLTRLRTGLTLNLIGSAFAQGSTFALNLAVANLLGRLAFGELTAIQTTLNTVGTLAQVATGYTATKYLAEFRDRNPERAARILHACRRLAVAVALGAAIVLTLAAEPLATRAYAASQLTPLLRTAAPGVLFIVMNGFLSGALAGFESYAALARVGVISGLVYVVLGVGGVYAGGVGGALIGMVASAGMQWLLLRQALNNDLRRWNISSRPRDSWNEKSTLLHFALPAWLTGLFTLPAFWLASAFLVRQPGGLEQMAIFGAANSFRVIVLFIPNVMTGVGVSLLNNQRTASTEGYRWVFWWNLALTTACASIGALGIIAVGPWLLTAFGKGFDAGTPVLTVLMFEAVIESVAVWIYQIMQSHGRMWLTLFCVTLPRDCLILTLAYVLTPSYGATGLALAHAAGWTVALVSIGIVTYRVGLAGTVFAAAKATTDCDPE